MFCYEPIVQQLNTEFPYDVEVLRLDLIDPEVSGNKWFKLKENIRRTRELNLNTIVTAGGPFSNHIAATAAFCRSAGMRAIGIVRGEAPDELNDTLRIARENGMQIEFVSRAQYDQIDTYAFQQQLENKHGRFYFIPPGGSNPEGLLGCMQILKEEWTHDYIFCACGTGTTFAGLLASARPKQRVIGFSVLKGANTLPFEICSLLRKTLPDKSFQIEGNECAAAGASHFVTNAYAFSGYAGYDRTLTVFKDKFENRFHLPLDHLYTVKLFYGLFDMLAQGLPKKGSRLLAIHSGGLQGNPGFEKRYQQKLSR